MTGALIDHNSNSICYCESISSSSAASLSTSPSSHLSPPPLSLPPPPYSPPWTWPLSETVAGRPLAGPGSRRALDLLAICTDRTAVDCTDSVAAAVVVVATTLAMVMGRRSWASADYSASCAAPEIPRAASLHLDFRPATGTCNSPKCPSPTTRTVVAAAAVAVPSVDASAPGNSIVYSDSVAPISYDVPADCSSGYQWCIDYSAFVAPDPDNNAAQRRWHC